MSPDPYRSIHMYLKLLCKIHVSGSVYKHPYVSQDPLRDPYVRIYVSTSTCISGTSARSMSPDPCISIHMYLRILCKNHFSDSCLSIYISQGPLQDPCLWIHVSASSNIRILCKIHVSDSCLSIHVSASLYLRVLCKIHVSIHVAASLYLRILYKIHVFGFMSQHPLIWILYKIHVFGLMSQHPYVSQELLQDPCLRIHVSASTNMDPLQDPHLWAHASAFLYLRLLCKIHVSGSVSQHPYVSQDPLQDPCLRIRI